MIPQADWPPHVGRHDGLRLVSRQPLFVVFTLAAVGFVAGLGLVGVLWNIWDRQGLLLLAAVGGLGLLIGWVVLWMGMTARRMRK